MNLDQVQSTIKTALDAMAVFAGFTSCILIEDGLQVTAQEDCLKQHGLAILIDQPRMAEHADGFRGVSDLSYIVDVYLRTNPKVKNAGNPKWNPLALEQPVVEAITSENADSTLFNLRFRSAEFFWQDVGNNSRLLTFWTPMVFGS